MNIGDKVKVVDSMRIYVSYSKMAKAMGLKKFQEKDPLSYYSSKGLTEGDVLIVLNKRKHLCYSERGQLIGCHCERLDEDFIISIEGVEVIEKLEANNETT